MMAELRGPSGCPWDREQTMSSLRPFILEEAHELVEAIRRGEIAGIEEELGDVLLEVVFVTQIAAEQGLFTMAEVSKGIRDKLVRRHPHVFGETSAGNAGEALERWEAIKASEKPSSGSALDDIPPTLPALARASKISKRAANVGFDWESRDQVVAKVDEELGELAEAAAAGAADAVHEEMGDLLFAIVNLARHSGVDAELALSDANEKFSKRFRYLEDKLDNEGRDISAATMEELEKLWQESKRRPE